MLPCHMALNSQWTLLVLNGPCLSVCLSAYMLTAANVQPEGCGCLQCYHWCCDGSYGAKRIAAMGLLPHPSRNSVGPLMGTAAGSWLAICHRCKAWSAAWLRGTACWCRPTGFCTASFNSLRVSAWQDFGFIHDPTSSSALVSLEAGCVSEAASGSRVGVHARAQMQTAAGF